MGKISCAGVVCILAIWIAGPVEASVAISLELGEVTSDDQAFGEAEVSGDSQAVSLATNLTNSQLLLRYRDRELELERIGEEFRTREASITWNYNERTDKNRFIGFGAGFFANRYELGPFEESVWGVQAGLNALAYIGGDVVFITGQAWYKLPILDEEDEEDTEDTQSGYELTAALGLTFGSRPNVSVMAGARLSRLELGTVFPVDDEVEQTFVAVRFYFP